MNEIVKNKMMREVMVVKNSELFKNIDRSTRFYENSEHNFEEIILWNYEYMVRHIAEENRDYKQPIPYGVVVNDKNEIFVYKRGGKSSNAGETRLHGKIAFGVGGHIEKEEESSKNPVRETLIKEIGEEINIMSEDIGEIEAFGYLNEEDGHVSEVHIGVVYLVKVLNDKVKLADGELDNGEFMNISDLGELINSGNYEVENWSNILLEPIKKHLNS